MRILHITPWYPSKEKPLEGIWIKRLVESVNSNWEVYHLDVTSARRLRVRFFNNDRVRHRIWQLPTKRWLVIEVVNFLLLGKYLFTRRFKNDFDLINFHIAYPQLVFWPLLKALVNKPVVVSEHWSAYHFNFGVEKKLPRIQRIFKQELPLITVSRSLAADIRSFSGQTIETIYQIPNVVDIEKFRIVPNDPPMEGTFLMASQWKWPKKPELIFYVFAELIKKAPKRYYRLRVAGYGPQLEELKRLSSSLGLSDHVSFVGALNSELLAIEMSNCSAFLHCSGYETFSVVCAEALCCGAPVIASDVGAIPELVDTSNGVLVHNTHEAWLAAIEGFSDRKFDRTAISLKAQEKFAVATVRGEYQRVLKSICEASK